MTKQSFIYIGLFLCFCLLQTCDSSHGRIPNGKAELNPIQSASFLALNALQINDKGNHIYSTFPGLKHDFLPSDSTFQITNQELKEVLHEICSRYDHDINPTKRDTIISEAVLAQEIYTVEKCSFKPSIVVEDKSDLRAGIWLLPRVLDRRDIILVW